MATRIEIELTSKVDNDRWTWRAAGAKLPKGTLAADLLWGEAKVGDTARAEVASGIDGIEVLAVHPPVAPLPPTNRIEIGQTPPETRKKPSRTPREHSGTDRPRRGRSSSSRAASDRARTPQRDARPRTPRISPKDIHKKAAVLAALPEHRPIAEQLLRGGMPAVRSALSAQAEQDREAGKPVTPPEAYLAIAEQLLPSIRLATWLDRAEAAKEVLDTLPLKDLRAIVAAADRSVKDPLAIQLRDTLNEALATRSQREIAAWKEEIGTALSENRLVRALRLSSRLPDPTATLGDELTKALSEAASKEMSPETPSDRWLVLIDAVASSPVRRHVVPTGLPADASPELIEFAKENAQRIPHIGQMLGIDVVPPPKPELVAKVARRRPSRTHGTQ